MAQTNNKYSRRTIALFWLILLAVVIGIILYLEQIAILYVLATLGLVVLLLIVAFADLEKVGRENLDGFSE
jgi:cytochrome b561